MISTFKKSKFTIKTFKALKKSFRCFIPLQKRNIQGKIHFITFSNKLFFIDFGFKYEIESFANELKLRIPNDLSLKMKCNFIKTLSFVEFNLIILRNFFLNKVLIETKKNNIDFKIFSFLFFLQQKCKMTKKTKQKKYYIKGRILNQIRGGFAVGICGYIAFMPASQVLLKNFGSVTFFYILSVDLEKHILVISQRKINGLLRRQLKKLGSRFLNFEKKNISMKTLR